MIVNCESVKETINFQNTVCPLFVYFFCCSYLLLLYIVRLNIYFVKTESFISFSMFKDRFIFIVANHKVAFAFRNSIYSL